VLELGQAVQNLHEVGGAELSGSTRGLNFLRQPYGFSLFQNHIDNCNSIPGRFQSQRSIWNSRRNLLGFRKAVIPGCLSWKIQPSASLRLRRYWDVEA
jgi:hypothetical protein